LLNAMTLASTNTFECIRAPCMRRLMMMHRRVRWRSVTRLRPSCLITKRDQQRGNVLAVLTSFGKRRARTVGPDAIGR
jgi:hypothetical protein